MHLEIKPKNKVLSSCGVSFCLVPVAAEFWGELRSRLQPGAHSCMLALGPCLLSSAHISLRKMPALLKREWQCEPRRRPMGAVTCHPCLGMSFPRDGFHAWGPGLLLAPPLCPAGSAQGWHCAVTQDCLLTGSRVDLI